MKLFDLLSKEDEQEIISKIIAPKFLEMGFVLISESEFRELKKGNEKAKTSEQEVSKVKKKVKAAKSSKRAPSTPFTVWGVDYKSIGHCVVETGISHGTIKRYKEAGKLESLIPKPENWSLEAQGVDGNGVVTKLRKQGY